MLNPDYNIKILTLWNSEEIHVQGPLFQKEVLLLTDYTYSGQVPQEKRRTQ
jgi:hypothetical protein